MSHLGVSERPIPVHTVEHIIESMPTGPYTEHYQPGYPDPDALAAAIHEVQSTEPVTTPRYVDRLQSDLTALAEGRSEHAMGITGRCSEPVDLRTPIDGLVTDGVRNIGIVRSVLGDNATAIIRGMGQNTKPRSNEHEELPDGTLVTSYMGDAVNDRDPSRRAPDPSRMVAAAVQARDLAAGLHEATGDHVPAAHEALLLPYDMASIYVDPKTGDDYLLSADLPWIGLRTNGLEGPHVKLLSRVKNPKGVKIGASSTTDHIAGLQERLNPDAIPGRLTFMLRFGRGELDELETVAAAIAKYAPEALINYDLHGVTESIDGKKIRAVSRLVEDAATASEILGGVGLSLHGVHLETIMVDGRMECVDTPDQRPIHPGNVDPQLNPIQSRDSIQGIAPHLLRTPTFGRQYMRQKRRVWAAMAARAAEAPSSPPKTPPGYIHPIV